MLRNDIAAQTSIIGLKVNNAEKEAIVPVSDPRIPPKLHRQTLLCASMWCPTTHQYSGRSSKDAQHHSTTYCAFNVLRFGDLKKYTEDIADKEHISIDVSEIYKIISNFTI